MDVGRKVFGRVYKVDAPLLKILGLFQTLKW